MNKKRGWVRLLFGSFILVSLIPVYCAGFIFGVAFKSFKKAMDDADKFTKWM